MEGFEAIMLLAIWFMMGWWAADVWKRKGRTGGGGWGLGLILGIIGVVIAYCLPSKKAGEV